MPFWYAARKGRGILRLLAIDGNSIMNRAFYGIKVLTTKDGTYTNAIYGFLNILLKMKEEVEPDAVAIAFDLYAPTFRHKADDTYKATRKGMPEELRQQVPILKELLRDLGYRLVECEGFEADDILGTLSAACEQAGDECVIATGDRDSLQLVREHVHVRYATTRFGKSESILYDEDKVWEVYGVRPEQLIDVKALMGDTSDNIPGVAGIGEKTALALVQKFGSLDEVYNHLDDPFIKKGVRAKLEAGKDSAYHSRYLATIVLDAPIDVNLSDYMVGKPNVQKVRDTLSRLEIFKLTEKLLLETSDQDFSEQVALQEHEEEMLPVTKNPSHQKLMEFFNTGEYGVLYYGSNTECDHLILCSDYELLVLEHPEDTLLQAVITQEGKKSYTFDAKPIYRCCMEKGLDFIPFSFIANLAAYILNPSNTQYELNRLCAQYQLHLPAFEGQDYAQELSSASGFLRLCRMMEQEIEENGQQELLKEIEQPLCEVLASMECDGFLVDVEGVRAFGKSLDGDIERLQREIYEDAGYEFNINSPKQLAEVLFVKLQLPAQKKTKSGYSTNAEVLEYLRPMHPIIDRILEYRKLVKLKSTYVEGLIKVAGPDGRIHTSFNQTETRTGRISSTEPNLQNIPVRTELGRELRRFFMAAPGKQLADADYSQIELRVLAHIAQDKNMIHAFETGEDIHTRTACQVFGYTKETLPPMMRSRAKAVNFGIVYGIGAFSLSKDIGVTVAEADRYIKDYLSVFSGVKQYMDDTIAYGKEHGYVQTMYARRRYLPELASKNKVTQAFGKRVAMNTPIQGSAADIIKVAMVRVYRRLKQEQLQARLILQVHDELIVEANEEDLERAQEVLAQEMEHAANLSVPLVVDIHNGKTWYDAKA